MANVTKDNVTKPTKDQRTVVSWMINDTKGGFQDDMLPSKGGHPQFVSIDDNDIARNPELLKAIKDRDLLKTATIDRQGVINVPIGKKPNIVQVPFVNVQAQIGANQNRFTYSHVNVVADKKVGKDLIKQAMNESMDKVDSRWIVETGKNTYKIQAERPS
ncbi:hypothetical protein F4821DRAFT_257309 [Hypoxylon rubiginosum]|uniref:Uncharacterized protein n=1 Tax=Hypoxylon rubiginosum TaxID=110542 RepID=A0ACC0D8U1_9PEZI|nr:hypothetical protein F4821DRAFT_257309 [Hypoxylon rubiginosum]